MNKQHENSKTLSSDYEEWHYVAIGAFVIFAVVLILIFVGSDKSAEKLGPVGDWFGGLLNPFVALLALIGLAKSISIQTTTLNITKNGLEKQMRLLRTQAARTSFFDLLNLRSEAVNSVQWNTGTVTYSGRVAISKILESLEMVAKKTADFTQNFQADLDKWNVPQNCPETSKPYVAVFAACYSNEATSPDLRLCLKAYSDDAMQLRNLEAQLGHIFRATYQVLKFAYECPDLDKDEKKDFSNYLRAQMSEGEFVFFALTGLTSIGEKSRAISIAFDFYEDRLYSIAWAHDLREFFDANTIESCEFAQRFGYPAL